MKYGRILALLLALCLLSGCSGLYSDSYVWVQEHNDPYAYKEAPETETEPEETEAPLPAVSNYYEIMSLLRGYVNTGVTQGQFLIEAYDGDREQELSEAFRAIASEDPIGAYAIERIRYTQALQNGAWLVTVEAAYRHTVAEIESVRSVRGNERALALITDALSRYEPSVTLRVSGYADVDLEAAIRDYCIGHPNTMVETPQITAGIYPDSGNVRVIALEFAYSTDRASLQGMQSEAESVLSSAERYAHYAAQDAEKLSLIYSYLTSRFYYREDAESGSVYSLLCEGRGSSESMAAVTAYLCERVGLPCLLVEGERALGDAENTQPAPYCWNIVCLDGRYFHVDFHRDALERLETCRLLYDAEMEGYVWDRDLYPVCAAEEQAS